MTSHASLLNESDRTVAWVITYTPLHNGAEILALLTPERQSEIVRRLAAFQSDDMPVWEGGTTCREVKTCCLCPRSGYTPCNPIGGIDLASRLLERLDEAVWQAILDDISQGNPELAGCIRQSMCLFEDIVRMHDSDVAAILMNVESSLWAIALKGASKELKEKIYKNMSKRAAKVLQEDMEYLGPQRTSCVEAVQREIVYIMKRLLAPTTENNDIQFVGWNDKAEQQHFVAEHSTGIMTSSRGINSSYQMTAKNLGSEWDGYTIKYVHDEVAEKSLRLVFDEKMKTITIHVVFGQTTANDIQQLINSHILTRNKFQVSQLGNGTGLIDSNDNTLFTGGGTASPSD